MSQLPNEIFSIIKSTGQSLTPRLGKLSLPGKKAIDTPHYLASTSRGVVPHITPDTFVRDTRISGVYVALEDFIEKAPQHVPPIYKFRPPDGSSPLRRFVALPDNALLVMGARRIAPVIAPAATPNTHTSVAVCTAVGFKTLKAGEYAEAAEVLKPDVTIALGDIPYGRALGAKRIEKGTDRMIEWMQHHVSLRKLGKIDNSKLFAPLLPVSCVNQQYYIDCLTEELKCDVAGLAIYHAESLEDLPEALDKLPRMAFLEPPTPHQILQQVFLGFDMLTIPFVAIATDAGIALSFKLSTAEDTKDDSEQVFPRPLGVDMWSSDHAVDLSPLAQGCGCYTCTNHHRAYLQHLLSAKEMLGWVLLQIHNHETIDRFFASIRENISDGTFQDRKQRFEQAYEPHLPEKTGQGPRIRGYQFKSEGPGETKRNKAPFTSLGNSAQDSANTTPPSADADARTLEQQGFAEKQQ